MITSVKNKISADTVGHVCAAYLYLTFSLILFNEYPTQDLITFSGIIFIPILIVLVLSRHPAPSNHNIWWFTSFILVIAASGLISHVSTGNFTYRLYEIQMTYLYPVPLFLCLAITHKKVALLPILLIALAACTVSLIYEQLSYKHIRAGTFYGRPIIWAGLSLTTSVIVAVLATYRLTGAPRLVVYILCATGGIACLLSQSRGPSSLLAIILIITSILLLKKRSSFRSVSMIAIAVILVAFTVASNEGFQNRIKQSTPNISSYFDEHGQKYTSIGIRFELWKVAIEAFKQYPLFGAGVDNLMMIKQQMIDNKEIHPASRSFTHVHNDLLQGLATRGLFGVVLYIWFLGWLMNYYRRARHISEARPYAISGIVLIGSFLYLGMTDAFLHTKLSIFYFITVHFLLIHAISIIRQDNSQTEQKRPFSPHPQPLSAPSLPRDEPAHASQLRYKTWQETVRPPAGND